MRLVSILVWLLQIKLQVAAATSPHQYSFRNRRGIKLNGLSWVPATEPLALVYIAHGYGEHMGYYLQLGSMLSEAGLAAFGHDHEGHGLSGGERVNIADFQLYVDDVFQDCQRNKQKYTNKKLPVFIFGHSMGGSITLTAALQHPNYFRGMMLTGPFIQNGDTHGNLNILNRNVANLASMVMPSFQAGNPIDYHSASADLKVVNKMDNDHMLWRGKVKAQQAVATFRAIDKINKKLNQVTTPFLVLHGSADTIVWPEGSRELFSRARARDKQIQILPGRMHHLIIDLGGEQVIQTVLQWILHRI